MKKLSLFLLILWTACFHISAQENIGIGGQPDASAKVDIHSSTSGFLMPRMTEAQRNAIASPADGLQIFNTDSKCFETCIEGIWYFITCPSICQGVPTGAPVVTDPTDITETEITIHWNPVTGANAYGIELTADESFSSGFIVNSEWVESNILSYQVTGLTGGTTYYYRVSARNICGFVTPGDILSVTTTTGTCTNSWASLGNFDGGAKLSVVSLTIGNYGYAFTGYCCGGASGSVDCWKFDPSGGGNGTWTQLANYPGGNVYSGVGFEIGGVAYVGTGYNRNINQYQTTFYKYDPGTGLWSPIANFPIAISNAVAFSTGGFGYVGTGSTDPNSATAATNNFYKYDPGADSWSAISPYPGGGGGGIQGAISFTLGSYGYVGTGRTGNSCLSSFYQYEPGTDTWTVKADYGGGTVWSATGVSLDTYGYAGLGQSSIGGPYLNTFWRYDAGADTWLQRADFTGSPRENSMAFAIGTNIYAGVGYDNSFLSDFYQYCP